MLLYLNRKLLVTGKIGAERRINTLIAAQKGSFKMRPRYHFRKIMRVLAARR